MEEYRYLVTKVSKDVYKQIKDLSIKRPYEGSVEDITRILIKRSLKTIEMES